ncbi:MAG: signal peptide peptidase SppA [Phycisphaerae bacterium]
MTLSPRPMRTRWLYSALAIAAILTTPALAAKKVLRVLLDGPIAEAPLPDKLMAKLFGEDVRSLREWTEDIRAAADDKEIAGMALILDEPQMSLAQLEELTRAIGYFRSKGKAVHAYSDYLSNRSYAVAAHADHITLAETANVDIVGIYAELTFYKGMLDKIGVQADMLHCGAYKSALEPYTRTEPSKEAAENVNWLLDGLFDRWVKIMADGRKQSVEQIKAAVDQAPLSDKKAKELKLIDEIGSFEGFTARLLKEYGQDLELVKDYSAEDMPELDMDNPFGIFQFIQELMDKSDEVSGKPGIGLVYITGPIMTGKSQPDPFGGEGSAGSTTLRAAFRAAEEDDNIKAVVIRVDSPGGSALASDIIWNAAAKCAKKKPLIVSMGGVAGSGGYYVAIPGETIFAEESTITGSIGVVGGKMVLAGLFNEKLGITTTPFARGKNSGLMSSMRPWNDTERAKITEYMNDTYASFKGRITASRGAKIKGDLENLAGGRVYTGRQALERGLVDKMGGLQDALNYAADKSGAGKDFEVHTLPKPKGFNDIMAEMFGKPTADEYEVATPDYRRHIAMQFIEPLVQELAPGAARRVLAGLRNLIMLDTERVGMMMPMQLDIR